MNEKYLELTDEELLLAIKIARRVAARTDDDFSTLLQDTMLEMIQSKEKNFDNEIDNHSEKEEVIEEVQEEPVIEKPNAEEEPAPEKPTEEKPTYEGLKNLISVSENDLVKPVEMSRDQVEALIKSNEEKIYDIFYSLDSYFHGVNDRRVQDARDGRIYYDQVKARINQLPEDSIAREGYQLLDDLNTLVRENYYIRLKYDTAGVKYNERMDFEDLGEKAKQELYMKERDGSFAPDGTCMSLDERVKFYGIEKILENGETSSVIPVYGVSTDMSPEYLAIESAIKEQVPDKKLLTFAALKAMKMSKDIIPNMSDSEYIKTKLEAMVLTEVDKERFDSDIKSFVNAKEEENHYTR